MPPEQPSAIQTYQLNELIRRKEALQEGFAAIDQANVPSVPEEIFKRDFLPVFAGIEKASSPDLLRTWYLIAGTPYQAVNVVDASGNFLIQVPPVLDRHSLKPAIHGSNLAAVFEEANQRSHTSPVLGARIISNELENRVTTSLRTEENQGLKEEWEKLFSYYGVTPQLARDSNANSSSSESDFEMD
jgi:hypothetical protein